MDSIAFLFDVDHPSLGMDYGSPCEQALLKAAKKTDTKSRLHSRLLRGDILLWSISSRLLKLIAPKPSAGPSRSLAYETGVDLERLKIVVGEFMDSIDSGWHTLDMDAFPITMATHSIACYSAINIDLAIAKQIDANLRRFPSYLGSCHIDVSNPIQYELLIKGLYKNVACISGGVLYLSRWETDEGVYEFGTEPSKVYQVETMPYDSFGSFAPPVPRKKSNASRPVASAQRISNIGSQSHTERIAAEVLAQAAAGKIKLHADFAIRYPVESQIQLPVTKLLGYALNDAHELGKHKARLFASILGLNKSDWRSLAFQLVEGVRDAPFTIAKATEYGVTLTVYIDVVGRNGVVAPVTTAWIVDPSGETKLVTAFPDPEGQLVGRAQPPPLVQEELDGAKRWEAIYSLAHARASKAASENVPTPMFVGGSGVVSEGEIGGAYVVLPDGRSKFARWLRENNLGHKHYPRGFGISAKSSSHSHARAKAYASEFSRVLWINNIDSEVVTYLD